MIAHAHILELEHNVRRPDAVYGLKAAIIFLAEHGAPLTRVQKTVLLYAVIAAYKNETDTWDHDKPLLPESSYIGEAWDDAWALIEQRRGT